MTQNNLTPEKHIHPELKRRLNGAAEVAYTKDDKGEDIVVLLANTKKEHGDVARAALDAKIFYPFMPVYLQLDPAREGRTLVHEGMDPVALVDKARAATEQREIVPESVIIIDQPSFITLIGKRERTDHTSYPHDQIVQEALDYAATHRQKPVRLQLESKPEVIVDVDTKDSATDLLEKTRRASRNASTLAGRT